jgi:hypothetical protein
VAVERAAIVVKVATEAVEEVTMVAAVVIAVVAVPVLTVVKKMWEVVVVDINPNTR